jgi:hypothetical protein
MTRFKSDDEVNIDDDDLEFIVQQVWKSRCAVSQKRFGGHVILTLTRWDPTQPPTPYNLVLIMQDDALRLATHGKSVFPPEVVNRIEARLAWAKEVFVETENNPYDFVPTRSAPRQLPLLENLVTASTPPTFESVVANVSYLLLGIGIGGLLSKQL